MRQNENNERKEQIPDKEEALLIEGPIEQIKREQCEAKKRDEEYKRLQVRYNKIVAWFTGGLLLTSTLVVVIYHEMAETMNLQLIEMQRSSTQTSQLIVNAANQTKNLGESLKATIENFHLEQRAWVDVYSIRIEKEPEETDHDIKVHFFIQNSGKTPAVNINNIFTVATYPSEPPAPKFGSLAGEPRQDTTLFPGDIRRSIIGDLPLRIPGQGDRDPEVVPIRIPKLI